MRAEVKRWSLSLQYRDRNEAGNVELLGAARRGRRIHHKTQRLLKNRLFPLSKTDKAGCFGLLFIVRSMGRGVQLQWIMFGDSIGVNWPCLGLPDVMYVDAHA